ncbi:starch-binding protein [Marinimicrobium sp. C2-29]|uniref:starch-binding protein n=1 Tax=Marinimicrobium sp. C2-29 TaxID=3139825 RepID=UPI0031390D05
MNNHNHTSPMRLRRWLQSALAVSLVSAAGASAQPTAGDTFVHLFEWQWSDIATECEQHLGPKGYAGVQVSPPQEHIQGDAWWTRYQPVSLTINNSRSGTRAEFIDMVDRCADAGVDIYVDAIINHMAAGSGTGTDGSDYSAGTLYPEFSSNDFHAACTINSEDYSGDAWRVRNCRLVGLPDLDTGAEYVRQTLADYMNDLIGIGVKGFRLDASKHMSPEDINAITARLNGSPYIFQEVIDLGGEAVSALEYINGGDVTEFKYSAEIGNQFKNGQLSNLNSFGEAWGFLGDDSAVVFTDNHDNQRGHGAGGSNVLTYKDGALYDLGNVFMLAWPYGYPKVMSSFAFTDSEAGPPSAKVHNNGSLNCYGSDWQCEHRWTPIANMVEFRQVTGGNTVNNWWDNGNNQIGFGRGNAGFVAINREGNDLNRTFSTDLPEGEYCNVLDGDFNSGNCDGETLWVDNQGRVSVSLPAMTALAIHIDARIDGSTEPEPEAGTVTATSLCYDNSANYSSPHIYYWGPSPSGVIDDTAWPGEAMSTHGDYVCYDPGVDLTSLNVIFNDNGGAQTDDLTYSGDGCYANGQWQSLEQCGFEVESSEPPAENTYLCYDNAGGYNDPHVYFWNASPSGAIGDASWPGEALHSNNGFYCYDTGAELNSLNVIFNDNGGAQTGDLSMGDSNTCYRQGQWTTLSDCGVSPQ